MRIISGKARGTKLYTLEGNLTRPTLDRVKESVFNIINNKIIGSIVLDLFAGSGAIGLEFASRGAKKVILADYSKEAIDIIKKNIQKTHLEEIIEIYNLDFNKLIKQLKNNKIDIIYLDPPYETDFIKQAILGLVEYGIIQKNTLIIAETDKDEKLTNIQEETQMEIIDKRKYGRAYIFFLKKMNRKEE